MQDKIRAVAAGHGCDRPASYWTGPGRAWPDALDLPPAPRQVITSGLAVIDHPGPLTPARPASTAPHAPNPPA